MKLWSAPGLWLFGLLLSAYTLTMSGHFYTPDELTRYQVAANLVDRGTVKAADGPSNHTNAAGYSYFPIGQSLLFLPVHAGVKLLARLAPVPQAALTELACAWLSSLATALMLLFLYLLLRVEGVGARAAVAACLAGGFGTLLWPYARFSFAEPVVWCCIAAALWLLRRRDGDPTARLRRVALAGLVYGFGVTVRIEYVLLAPLLFSMDVLPDLRPGREPLFALGRGLLLTGVVSGLFGVNLAYNQARYGTPLDFGQATLEPEQADKRPVVDRAVKVLRSGGHGAEMRSLMLRTTLDYLGLVFLSPAKCVFLYAPLLLLFPLGAWRALRARPWPAGHLLAGSLLMLAFFAVRNYSVTGWTWGARYMYFLCPVGVLYLAWLLDSGPGKWLRRATWLLVVLGALIQLPALLSSMSVTFDHIALGDGKVRPRSEWLWQPEHTLLWQNTRQVAVSWRETPGLLRARRAGELARLPADRRVLRIRRGTFDLWFLYAYLYGVPAGPIAGAMALLLLLLLLSAWRLARLTPSGSAPRPAAAG